MNQGVNKPTRNEQREAAREKAKAMREQHKKGERRKRFAIQAGIIGAIAVAVSAVVISLVSTSNNQALQATPTNMTFDGGIKIGQDLKAFTATTTPTPDSGKAVPNIQVYLDYQCPVCQAFEVPNASQLESWVKTGAATVEYHPISFLDGRGSPNEYSSRAANAAICVAEHSPDNYFKFNNILFANQPQEGTPGPSNQDLISRAREAGVAVDDTFSSCVNDKVFANWISDTTDKVLSEPIKGTNYTVEGTPYILVNGKPYTWNKGEELVSPARFAQFVQAAN